MNVQIVNMDGSLSTVCVEYAVKFIQRVYKIEKTCEINKLPCYINLDTMCVFFENNLSPFNTHLYEITCDGVHLLYVGDKEGADEVTRILNIGKVQKRGVFSRLFYENKVVQCSCGCEFYEDFEPEYVCAGCGSVFRL